MSEKLRERFTAPNSIMDAEWKAAELSDEIQRIADQLGDPAMERNHVTGEKKSEEEYANWQAKARAASSYKKAELSFLKLWMKEQRGEQALIRGALGEALPLIMDHLPPALHPPIEKLLSVAGFITGSYT